MRIRTAVAIVAGAAALAGCKGLKDALTAHTDVAAEAGNTELSATRLGAMLGNARIGIDPSKENAQNVDEALKPIFDNMRVSMMIDTLRTKGPTPQANPEAAYNAGMGGIVAARHI